ncbi:hypothetical protein [Saccharothrix variisporea]|uniref:hypothetical protein n=1 Tax=Saccharothrix variisporea TaxID=543527 RepID=UPI001FED2884|nr:hypothetical protein [Saccharothrix variisporea]
MNLTYKVNVWELKVLQPGKNGKRRHKPYGVRWITAGHEHSEWYATKKLADKRRNKLISAMEDGEPFDIVTGLPKSEAQERSARTLLRLAQEFVAHEWKGAAPNTRKRYVDTLAIPVAEFVTATKGRPDERVLRRVLTGHLLLPQDKRTRELSPDELAAARWIEAASRPVKELNKIETATLLRSLGQNLGGKPAADWTTRTRRGVLHHLFKFGVDAEAIPANPVTGQKAASQRGNSEVDPRVVVNPDQARSCLAAVTYAGRRPGRFEYLFGFFATMYYAAMRPCEVNRLREQDCKLPESGWGELLLEKRSATSSGGHRARSGRCRFRRRSSPSCGGTSTPSARHRMAGCSEG